MTVGSAKLFDYTRTDTPRPPKVVISYGMGLDSSSLLLRWLEDPSSRNFELDDLAVVTAMTGNEFDTTRAAVEKAYLAPTTARSCALHPGGPLAAQNHQGRRRGGCPRRFQGTPASVLLRPLHSGCGDVGSWNSASVGWNAWLIHSKANCLDPVIARITQGERYRHVIGFEANEQSRATKDALYNTPVRQGWYPLI